MEEKNPKLAYFSVKMQGSYANCVRLPGLRTLCVLIYILCSRPDVYWECCYSYCRRYCNIIWCSWSDHLSRKHSLSYLFSAEYKADVCKGRNTTTPLSGVFDSFSPSGPEQIRLADSWCSCLLPGVLWLKTPDWCDRYVVRFESLYILLTQQIVMRLFQYI